MSEMERQLLIINTKNCSLSIVLTATDQKLQESLKKGILPTITSLECQRDLFIYKIFCPFGLKTPIHATKIGVFEGFHP